MRVAVYAVNAGGSFGNKRAQYIARAFHQGLRHCGIQSTIHTRFDGVQGDLAVAYGWVHEPIFTAYKNAGAHYAYWDLGYWGRRPSGAPSDGYHRLGLDSWDTADLMARGCPVDRFARLGIEVLERHYGGEILIAGMSEKAGGTHGYALGEWEEKVRAMISSWNLGYDVIVRPKPGRTASVQIPIEQALARSRILVTHHSNAAIDALVAGVPCYTVKGVGRLASPVKLDAQAVEVPYFPEPDERFQILADVAYAQWSPPEMQSGEAWQHIKRVLQL